jgi:hypothetical protein
MTTLTLVHVAISLIGIGSGFVVLLGFLAARRLDGWTALFLASTVATSVTGFLFFPFHHFLPSHAVGIISLLVLVVAIYARYPRRLAGAWRWIYVVAAAIALYLNVFVGIVQAFEKKSYAEGYGPDPIRTAICDYPTRHNGAFHRTYRYRDKKIPQHICRFHRDEDRSIFFIVRSVFSGEIAGFHTRVAEASVE